MNKTCNNCGTMDCAWQDAKNHPDRTACQDSWTPKSNPQPAIMNCQNCDYLHVNDKIYPCLECVARIEFMKKNYAIDKVEKEPAHTSCRGCKYNLNNYRHPYNRICEDCFPHNVAGESLRKSYTCILKNQNGETCNGECEPCGACERALSDAPAPAPAPIPNTFFTECRDCTRRYEKYCSYFEARKTCDRKQYLASLTQAPAPAPKVTKSIMSYYSLFLHMRDEHGLTLVESELYEILRIAEEIISPKQAPAPVPKVTDKEIDLSQHNRLWAMCCELGMKPRPEESSFGDVENFIRSLAQRAGRTDKLQLYLDDCRKIIESSIASEVLAGNKYKEDCERTALAEITALDKLAENLSFENRVVRELRQQ